MKKRRAVTANVSSVSSLSFVSSVSSVSLSSPFVGAYLWSFSGHFYMSIVVELDNKMAD